MVNINFMRFLDKILIIKLILLYPFRNLFFRKSKSKKVLIIRLWALGDSINLLPILKTLNDKGYLVDVLTTISVSNIFENQKFVNKIMLFDFKNPFSIIYLIKKLNNNDYEIIIDSEQFMNMSTVFASLIKSRLKIGYNHLFRSNFYNKSIEYSEKKHFIENFYDLLKPLQIEVKNKKLVPLNYNKKSIKKVDEMIKSIKSKKKIGINIGTGGTALGRRWNEEKFVKLENLISRNKNIQVIFTGTYVEDMIYTKVKNKLSGRQISFIKKLNLSDFIYFLSKIDLFISNDTGPMHMAAAMGTNTIGLFGMNDPIKVGAWPLDKNVNIFKNPKNNPIINNKYSIYPNDKYSTIDLITVEDVYNKIMELIK